MNCLATLNLHRSFFSEKEKLFAVNGKLKAFLFIFDSGVHGVRIENECGYIVVLPYQGQQIWSCNLLNRELIMKSMFSEPIATDNYMNTYGGFLLHCGATAMGVPSQDDTHSLHGELPSGQYHHQIAYNSNYLAEPFLKIYENSSGRYISTVTSKNN